jgi:hypothetical protein
VEIITTTYYPDVHLYRYQSKRFHGCSYGIVSTTPLELTGGVRLTELLDSFRTYDASHIVVEYRPIYQDLTLVGIRV